MKIAFSAPADLHALARFCGHEHEDLPAGLGGTATTPMICELARRGHEVTLYTLSKGLRSPRSYTWDNLRIVVGPFRERHLAATYFGSEIRFLRQAIEADAPPFVHAHWTYEFALGALRARVPTLTTIHDLPWRVLRHYRDFHRAVRLAMSYEVATRGKHFSAVSEAASAHFARCFKLRTDIPVISNGLADEVFELGRNARPDRGRTFTFATVLQGWSRRKNACAALKAFAAVRRELPQSRLMMFGCDYEPLGPAHRWAMAHGLDRDAIFAGALEHRSLLLAVAEEVDLLVHPSLDEAFSMAALEAMALRKPLIAGETTPGMREMLGPGGGVLVDVRNTSALAQAMLQVAGNADYRRHLAQHGAERTFRLYRMKAIVDQYEALYSRLAHTHNARSRPHMQAESQIPLDL